MATLVTLETNNHMGKKSSTLISAKVFRKNHCQINQLRLLSACETSIETLDIEDPERVVATEVCDAAVLAGIEESRDDDGDDIVRNMRSMATGATFM